MESQRVRVCGDVRGHEQHAEQLEHAYERLRSLAPGDDSAEALREIERLERSVLRRHDAAIVKRDSTVPPPPKR